MNINKELLKGSTVIMILTLLRRSDMYGYEMARQIELHSEGALTLKEGTLYPLLHTLETNGWVRAYWRESDGRNRKYYSLTDDGALQLHEKKREWHAFRTAVDRVLAGGQA